MLLLPLSFFKGRVVTGGCKIVFKIMNSSFRCDIISTFKDMLSQYSKDTAKVFITPYLFCLLALSKPRGTSSL